MRAKSTDPPRTMAQKIFVGRAGDAAASAVMGAGAGDLVEVKVDQVVLARAPMRAMGEALALGMKKTGVEVAVAYDGACVSEGRDGAAVSPRLPIAEVVAHGVLVARPGVGFASSVHLERFASPARLCVTDEPRLAGVGGAGMLTIVVAPAQLGQALAQGRVWLRPPCSIQVSLAGKMRPFVCARDVSLELVRRGVGDVVRRVEAAKRAPVVVEFTGPSVRLLSVSERAVLASLAPSLGAAAALFVSDERTEVFLRDQRRSKAHRALVPDAGAPCDEVVSVDLGAVDPLVMAEDGVRAARDLAGTAVSEVLLGGDGGATLRDLFAAATLLKSKRVSPRVDLLLSVPSRQMLEVLAGAGALTDLIATGARLIEPDARIMTGEIYPPRRATPTSGVSARTCDLEPREPGMPSPVIASAQTLAYAVATGEIGDPRSFKRPVRVIVPRALPTDDVLIVRERRGLEGKKKERSAGASPASAIVATPEEPRPRPGWSQVSQAQTLAIVHAADDGITSNGHSVAVVCATLDEVRRVAARAADVAGSVRAVIAPFIPSATVALFSAMGIAAFEVGSELARFRENKTVSLPAPAQWTERQPLSASLGSGPRVTLTWLARGAERAWVARASKS